MHTVIPVIVQTTPTKRFKKRAVVLYFAFQVFRLFFDLECFYMMFYRWCKFSNPEARKIHSVSLIRFQRSTVINLKMSRPVNFRKIDFLKAQQTAGEERRCSPLQTHKAAPHRSSRKFNLGDSRGNASLTSHLFNIC